jgi:NAD-dependent deacetylase sirtuin 3
MSDKVPVCTFCQATVKPDIVFFGEDLPEKYFLHSKDFPKADLLIIMGTSLQVNLKTVKQLQKCYIGY